MPWDYGGAAPQRVLHGYMRPEYLPGMDCERTGLPKPVTHLIEADLPPFGMAIVKPTPVSLPDNENLGLGSIEDARFRLELDPATGAIGSCAITKLTSSKR